MARRRGSRITRRPLTISGRGVDQVSATTYVTIPSGVTMDKQGLSATTFTGELTGGATGTLHGTVDYGQSRHLKFYRGTSGLTATPSGGGTALSAGTFQVTTGLTTVDDFLFSFNLAAGSTIHESSRYPHKQSWLKGYIDAGGVTVFLYNSNGAATPMATAGLFSGVSLSWLAIGV